MTMATPISTSSAVNIGVIDGAVKDAFSTEQASRLDASLSRFLEDCAEILDLPEPDNTTKMLQLVAEVMNSRENPHSCEECFVTRVENAIHRLLHEGTIGIERVASEMAMSTRTLQRRLTAEGLTFTDMVDAMRRQAATSMLADAGIPITEVAYELGFSEPSTFYRAFKRWTGDTPAGFRKTFAH